MGNLSHHINRKGIIIIDIVIIVLIIIPAITLTIMFFNGGIWDGPYFTSLVIFAILSFVLVSIRVGYGGLPDARYTDPKDQAIRVRMKGEGYCSEVITEIIFTIIGKVFLRIFYLVIIPFDLVKQISSITEQSRKYKSREKQFLPKHSAPLTVMPIYAEKMKSNSNEAETRTKISSWTHSCTDCGDSWTEEKLNSETVEHEIECPSCKSRDILKTNLE